MAYAAIIGGLAMLGLLYLGYEQGMVKGDLKAMAISGAYKDAEVEAAAQRAENLKTSLEVSREREAQERENREADSQKANAALARLREENEKNKAALALIADDTTQTLEPIPCPANCLLPPSLFHSD